MRRDEMNRFGMHDVKSRINKKFLKKFLFLSAGTQVFRALAVALSVIIYKHNTGDLRLVP